MSYRVEISVPDHQQSRYLVKFIYHNHARDHQFYMDKSGLEALGKCIINVFSPSRTVTEFFGEHA